jgi:adenylosuccinate lyase
LGEITATAGRLVKDAADLMEIVEVRPDAMRANIGRTGGLIMAEQAMLLLGPHIGKHTAHHEVRLAAAAVWDNGTALVDEIAARPGLARHVAELDLVHALDPLAYTGQSAAAADRTVAAIEAARASDTAALA